MQTRIATLDLNFQDIPECVAAFLVYAPDGPILVECGPSTSRPNLVAALAEHGIQPEQIKAVLVTHIHLDHSGSVGWWAQQGAQVYVHAQGAPHLIDPSKLLASATRIYGDRMETLWGDVPACPADKVTAVEGDCTIHVAGLDIQCWESPGHARHHYAFQIGKSLLCGDVAAVRLPYNDSKYLSVPAPPPEFDLEMWLSSLDKLEKLDVDTLYLTHFGAIKRQGHFEELRERLPKITEFVGQRRSDDRDALVAAYYQWHQDELQWDTASFEAYEKANPLFMSIDGLLRYWKKKTAAVA